MNKLKKFFGSFTPFEITLWLCSVVAIALSFFLSGSRQYENLVCSLIGACSVILVSKGNVAGQFLAVLFGGIYGFISYSYRYYGEMITYLGMTVPIAVVSIVTWLKNPYRGNRAEVTVNRLKKREYPLILLLSAAVTVAFYFILKAFHTANLAISTLSVFTSFLAVSFSVRRSPLYAVGYALNDVVLIVMWSLASAENSEYLCMVVCCAVFLANDLYGFYNWQKIKRRQQSESTAETERTDEKK